MSKFTMTVVAAIIAGSAMGTGAAMAQNGSIGGAPLLQSINQGDVTSMLGEFGIATEVQPSGVGQAPMIIAKTTGNAKFLVGFFDCADAAAATGCRQAMISTAQPSSGVEFDDINAFNGASSVTTVVYESSNQILIFGRNVFVPGGIGRDNFKLQVALFLQDMQNFVQNRRAGAASVSFSVQPNAKSKITSIKAGDDTPLARRMIISVDGSAEVDAAINNSLDVDFAVDFHGLR